MTGGVRPDPRPFSQTTFARSPGPPPAPQQGSEPPKSGSPEDKRVHVLDAASTQREQVLNSFDMQRKAILKAVADQREAALAPVKAVQARKTMQNTQSGSAAAANPAVSRPAAMPAGAQSAPGGQPTPQQLVAADIVAALKAMVAEEVRVQLVALLEAATLRDAAGSTPSGRDGQVKEQS
jgi:hypothetical protein